MVGGLAAIVVKQLYQMIELLVHLGSMERSMIWDRLWVLQQSFCASCTFRPKYEKGEVWRILVWSWGCRHVHTFFLAALRLVTLPQQQKKITWFHLTPLEPNKISVFVLEQGNEGMSINILFSQKLHKCR
jgi:hypothetical protein